MRCAKCNHELDNNNHCPNCDNLQDVQTMTNKEADSYNGVTIEDENNFRKETAYQQNANQYQRQANARFYRTSNRGQMKVHYINFGSSSRSNWLTKGLIAIGGIAILGFFLFVALPVLLTLVGAGIVAWLIFRFFRH